VMPTFHLVLRQSGPEWRPGRPLEEQTGWQEHAEYMDALVDEGFVVLGGPVGDEGKVVHVVEAESDDAVRARLALDPWSDTHLVVEEVEPWTLRLDGRKGAKP
jgi:uncharacterized protein YciI